MSNIYAKKKGIAKKLILTLRAIMISQEVDLVAGDFNGTAWRYRSEDNFSTIDEALSDCALQAPHHCGTRIHPEQWGRRLWISQTTGFSTFSGKCISMVHSPSHGKRFVYVPPIIVAITKHGLIWTSWIGTTGGPCKTFMRSTFP